MITRLVPAVALCLAAAAPQAAEDCFNSPHQWQTTSTQPENLRVTDADIEALRLAIARHEARIKAQEEADKTATAALKPEKGGG